MTGSHGAQWKSQATLSLDKRNLSRTILEIVIRSPRAQVAGASRGTARLWLLVFVLVMNQVAMVAAQPSCIADCDENGETSIDELVLNLVIALGMARIALCPPGDVNSDGHITVDEIVHAVHHSLAGCPPTIMPTDTVSPTPTETETEAPPHTATTTQTPSASPTATPPQAATATATATPTETISMDNAIVLADRTSTAGVETDATACLVFRDLDGDGWPDILVAGADERGTYSGSLLLFRNNGDGTFQRDTIPLPFTFIFACTVGDMNNDGAIDIVAVGTDTFFNIALAYLQGVGSGEFQDTSTELPDLTQEMESAQAIAVFDYDVDGLLDILIGSFGSPPFIDLCEKTEHGSACYLNPKLPTPPAPVLIRNIDGTRFEKAPISFQHSIRANAFNFIDWDEDGYVDVFVSGDYGVNRFYRNLAGKGFEDWLPGWGLNEYNHGMGAVFGDFDEDRQWDIYVAELGEGFVYSRQPDGSLTLRPIGPLAAATRTDNIWSPVAADFDNDGLLDVFAPSGSYAASLEELYTMALNLEIPATIQQSDCLIRNAGNGSFEVQRIPNPSEVIALYPKQSAAADYDGDGRVDIAVVGHSRSRKLRLLRNETPTKGNHWIGLRLIGKSGARDQVGATVTLLEGTEEIARRAVNIGGIGVSWEVAHFGVGSRQQIDSARIRWADGTTSELSGPLEVDQIIEVRQP